MKHFSLSIQSIINFSSRLCHSVWNQNPSDLSADDDVNQVTHIIYDLVWFETDLDKTKYKNCYSYLWCGRLIRTDSSKQQLKSKIYSINLP